MTYIEKYNEWKNYKNLEEDLKADLSSLKSDDALKMISNSAQAAFVALWAQELII